MFPEIVYKGNFQNPSPGRCPLVAYLAGTYFSNKTDRKALQYPITIQDSTICISMA